MNEFSLIKQYFHSISFPRDDVIFGIGDDAACVQVPFDSDLLVSTDTLVEGNHFLKSWDAYDIASRAVRVNISDMAAMGAKPCWASLAITLPSIDENWLQRFSLGLAETLGRYHTSLIGGDTTKGPLSITLTIHGLAPKGRAVRRCTAQVGDIIVVSGPLGAAAFAITLLDQLHNNVDADTAKILLEKLLHPTPRVDLMTLIQAHATAAIDISDGLSADLNHILEATQVGACIDLEKIPVHPLVKQYASEKAIDFALSGGDDYELCFTTPRASIPALQASGFDLYCIGQIEEKAGLRAKMSTGEIVSIIPKGYSHF